MIDELAHNELMPYKEIFYDPEESEFYGRCVEALVTNEEPYGDVFKKGIVEFGSGNGLSVARALKRARFTGSVRGIELETEAYQAAQASVKSEDVGNVYEVGQGDFFEVGARGEERCAIGNPPYLPAEASEIRIPGLWGGADGSDCLRRLLDMDFELLMSVISSISNPAAVLAYGRDRGYVVSDWVARPLTFGVYSREPVVWERIQALRADHKAFFLSDEYMIAGATWVRPTATGPVDRSASLERTLTSFYD